MNDFDFDYLGVFGNMPVTTPELVRELTMEDVDEKSDKEVNIIPAESISISSSTTTIQTGGSLSLQITTTPEIANAPVVVWESSDPSIAMVNDKGVVIAFKAGKVEITATSPKDNTITSKITLTVSDKPEESGGDEEEETTIVTEDDQPITTEDGTEIVTEG